MREKLTSNLGLKAASVLLAILLWFLVVNAVDPVVNNTVRGITVEVRNGEAITGQGKKYEIVSGQTVNITVDAKKTDWSSIRASDFCAYVDMNYAYGVDEKNQAVQIHIEVVNNKSIIDEDSIQFQSEGVMYFKTEDIIDREMPVEVEEEGELSENYRLGETEVSPGSVTVTAPESLMGRVSRVVARLDRSALNSETTAVTVKPVVLDANGNEVISDELSLSTDEVTISTNLMLTKSVTISCAGVTGTPADGYLYSDFDIDPETITVMGSRSSLAGFPHILIPAEELNIEQAQSNVVKTIDITQYLPEGVTVPDGMETVTVTLHIEQLQSKTYRMPVGQLNLENKNPDYEYDVRNTTIAVTLTGLKEDLDVLTANQLIASVDVANLTPGIYRLEVTMHLESGYEQTGTVTAEIEIRDPAESREPETEAPSSGEETTDSGSSGAESSQEP